MCLQICTEFETDIITIGPLVSTVFAKIDPHCKTYEDVMQIEKESLDKELNPLGPHYTGKNNCTQQNLVLKHYYLTGH